MSTEHIVYGEFVVKQCRVSAFLQFENMFMSWLLSYNEEPEIFYISILGF